MHLIEYCPVIEEVDSRSKSDVAEAIGPDGCGSAGSFVEGRLYALFMLYIVYALNFLDRQILSILIEPIKLEFQFSDTQLGFLTGLAFAMFYATLGVPIARAADRHSRRNIIAICLAIWSAMTVFCGLANNFLQMTLARFGVAVGEAGCVAPAQSMLADYFPERLRGRGMAVFASAIYLGILVGLAFGGWVSDNFGWRAAFFMAGAPGILLAIIFIATVREPARGEAEFAPDTVTRASFSADLGALLKRPTFVWIAVGLGAQSMAGYGLMTWLPSFYRRFHDVSIAQAGFSLSLIIGFGGLLGALIGGWLSDALAKKNNRWYLWISAIAAFVCIPFFLGALFVSQTDLSFIFLTVAMFIGAVHSGPLYAAMLGVLEPQRRAVGTAVMLFANNLIGIGLGSLFVGVMSDFFASIGQSDPLRYSMIASLIFLLVASLSMFMGSAFQSRDWISANK